jgi:acyl-CoA thioester hydrolase
VAAVDATTNAGGGDRCLLRIELPLRWRDLDAFGHVNNSIFLTYVEEARLRWLTSLHVVWMDDAIAPLLAATHFNFRRPIEWPETLAIELRIERVGNSSLTLAHRILSQRDADRVYADGNSVMVWIERAGGRPVPLPAAIRAACEAPA